MSKKKSSKTITTRTSAKQKFAAYKTEALEFINSLRYPTSQHAFSVKSYETTPMGKKAVILSAPEILAITSTARMLGKTVRVSTSGSGDTTTLDFSFVDSTDKPVPYSLQ
jgi:hypothetical protein